MDGVCILEQTWLVVIEFEAHVLGVRVVGNFLSERGLPATRYDQITVELLHFVLTGNIFIFNGSHVLQV